MAAFPPPPTDTIDWANVGFQVREVNGHIESTYSKSTGQWTPLKFVASPFMRIHGMAPALNYGQQAYEGLKAFRGPGDDTIALFRPDRNALRLQHSADAEDAFGWRFAVTEADGAKVVVEANGA
ncbi:Mitotic spindle checkpoint component mad2 [Verticillium dahliae VDG1]|nr:Mitotic spindle checkpoint component mad2 [Verticillium dahliae VDG1]